jgi:hypothetical protein
MSRALKEKEQAESKQKAEEMTFDQVLSKLETYGLDSVTLNSKALRSKVENLPEHEMARFRGCYCYAEWMRVLKASSLVHLFAETVSAPRMTHAPIKRLT